MTSPLLAMAGMGAMPRVTFSAHTLFTRWEMSAFPLVVALGLAVIGLWYLQADWKLAARGRRWSAWRTVSFFAGLLTVDIALQSPVATLTGTYFEAHVVQHLLLMAVAPPFLAMGAPSTLFLQTSSRRAKERWLAVLRSRPFAALTHPAVVGFLYYGVMFVFFLTSLIGFAMEHMWLMDLINLFFLFGGTLFWWPMVGIDPIIHWKLGYGMRMFLVLVGSGIEAFLGVAILFMSQPIAPMYTLSSTHVGGGLLWTAADVLSLTAFLPIYVQWQRSEERAGRRLDARGDIDWPTVSPTSVHLSAGSSPTKVSAWEAAWRERAGAVPVLDGSRLRRPADLLPLPEGLNGRGGSPEAQ